MLEFGEEVFSIELIVIKKVLQGVVGLLVFINPEEVLPLPFGQLYLDVVIDAEVKSHPMVQLPAELIVLYRGHHSQQAGALEELFGHIVYVQLELHDLLFDAGDGKFGSACGTDNFDVGVREVAKFGPDVQGRTWFAGGPSELYRRLPEIISTHVLHHGRIAFLEFR